MGSSLEMSNLNHVWDCVLKKIKEENLFDESIYNSFLIDSDLKEINNSHAIIEVPYFINREFFKNNIKEFENKLTTELNQLITCDVVVKGREHKSVQSFDNVQNEDIEFNFGNKIYEEYTFDNFVEGKSNEQSYAAAYGCAISSNSSFFNPLFIYGNSGLGKTHLLHAICNYIKDNRQNIKYLYIDGNDLISILINATRNRTINELINKLSNLDYLLIDDIQHLARTKDMQDIFFNLYNKLISNNKQIVFSSDVYPSDLKNINQRLLSRFNSGLSVGITSPEYLTAVSILHKKLEGRNKDINITEDALSFIASNFNEDVRQLEGALNELLFKAVFYNPSVINKEFTSEIFKSNPKVISNDEVTPKTIKKEVCNYYNISVKQIESKSRTADIANARHIAIYLCREILDLPFKKIGQEFGGRDHSTIMTSYDKISKLVKDKSIYEEAVGEIKKRLGY